MATPEFTIYGHSLSPNVRAARLAFAERSIPVQFSEIGFDVLATDAYAARNPFRKMPTLSVAGADFYETPSLMVLANGHGQGPSLEPVELFARAQMWKLVGVAQNYLYANAIMKFFFHRVVASILGATPDPVARDAGAEATRHHLAILERTVAGRFLVGAQLSFADLYCGAMLEPLLLVRDGRALFDGFAKTRGWLDGLAARESFRSTSAPVLAAHREA